MKQVQGFPRNYSAEEKKTIMNCAESIGVVAAARKFGVPPKTIYDWRYRARMVASSAPPSALASDAEATEDKQVRASKGRRYSPAEKKLILEMAEYEGIAASARKHQCSTWSVYHWLREKQSTDAQPSPGTGGREHTLSPEQEERHRLALEIWRTNPGFGPSQVRNQLKRLGYRVSVHTVRDVMTANGYIQPRVQPKKPERSFEVARPLQLYHLDFLHFHVHKQRQCLLLIEDDYSRFIAGWALLKSEHAHGVVDTLDASINRYGKPEGVMIDRGAAFYSFKGVARFEQYVTESGIDYFPVDEAYKNGKLERLNATVRKELLTKVEFADLEDAVVRIGVWVHQYNYRRTHMALGGLLVPADRFHGMAEDALRRIEQGNPASPLEVLTPADRGLEILRVVSVAGQVAAYLMGKKIFG